jgi:hypothetical protein
MWLPLFNPVFLKESNSKLQHIASAGFHHWVFAFTRTGISYCLSGSSLPHTKMLQTLNELRTILITIKKCCFTCLVHKTEYLTARIFLRVPICFYIVCVHRYFTWIMTCLVKFEDFMVVTMKNTKQKQTNKQTNKLRGSWSASELYRLGDRWRIPSSWI